MKTAPRKHRRGPVEARRHQGKVRILIMGTRQIARNSAGTPVDGGGHTSAIAARRQARTINSKLKRRGIIA